MKRLLVLGLALLAAAPATAQRRAPAPPPPPATLTALADQVSEQSLRGYVERLVGFGTRHT
ncbi:MAG TPA: hypothetical protein VGC46_11660, partial [Allosphingosinicella sp.]